jgi:SAM-dependent methyltransferase
VAAHNDALKYIPHLGAVSMLTKKESMVEFWSERAQRYGRDPRANTNDVHLRELEIQFIDRLLAQEKPRQVLDFGCANGFSTRRLARRHTTAQFCGIDINAEMIEVARHTSEADGDRNIRFEVRDVLANPPAQQFDVIYAVRVFQNIESPELQRKIADRLIELVAPGGLLVYIESYADGYQQLNDDRMRLGLDPLPIHKHLTLLTDAFDEHVASKLTLEARESVSSSYYLITRLVYSALAKESGEAIDYDHPLHRLAAAVPQIGKYGPQQACVFRKAKSSR